MAGIYNRTIQGYVFEDTNYNGNRNDLEGGLGNVKINLYEIINKDNYTDEKSNTTIYREKLIGSTKTDSKGEFKFNAGKGLYAVSLDINSLPDGMGTTQINKFVSNEDRSDINFAVRNISSIEFETERQRDITIDDAMVLNPILRDRRGNILSAKINLISDSSEITFDSGVLRSKPVSFNKKYINIYAVAGNLRKQITLALDPSRKNTLEKINFAYRSGMIDEHTRILNSLYSIFNKSKLPEEFRSKIPIKCGTGILEDIRRYSMNRDAIRSVVEETERYISTSVPKLDKIYKSPAGFFNIHYTTEGENAVSLNRLAPSAVPQYILEVGKAFDYSKKLTCDDRGFKTPVLEKGKDALDVYVYDLKGVYGITFSTNYSSVTGSRHRTAASYISIDNNYSREKGFDKSREDCMKVTAAHEFFHAVQNAYNADADTWWKEASATWNEDEVFNGVNDYIRYLDRFFSSPHKSLDDNSYGGVVFAKFLSENYGGYEIIKSIWNTQASYYKDSIKAIDRTVSITGNKQNLGIIYNKFTAYNVNPSQYYKGGNLWNVKVAVQNTYSNYPVPSNTGSLNHLASNYLLFKPGLSHRDKTLKLIIEGEGLRGGFKIQKRKRGEYTYQLMDISSSAAMSRIEVEIKNFNTGYEEIYFIPSNLEKELNDVSYTYSAEVLL